MSAPQEITYVAEPTPAQFHASDAFVRGIMGPVGSGKSVACCMEILNRAHKQRPDRDGRRRTSWVVIRNTYPELKSTTINTWKEWIPETICPLKWDSPISGRMVKSLPDGTVVDILIQFMSIDRDGQSKKFLSLEVTGAWINEAREVPKAALDILTTRVGRFPAKRDFDLEDPDENPITYSGIIMDTNPPDDDHWWYDYAEHDAWKVDLPEEVAEMGKWEFWRQPGALIQKEGKYCANPKAENVKHQSLGYSYWYRQIQGKTKEWIKAYVLGQYASVFSGKPVYGDNFNDDWHVSDKPLKPYSNIPLRLGWDFGLTPACIIGQMSPSGQLRILKECVCENGAQAGIKQFTKNVVLPTLANHYAGIPIISRADPAGDAKSQTDEVTPIDILKRAGIPTQAACTNKFLTRRESVLAFLLRMVDGKPGLLLDPSCQVLRKGFNGAYHFRRIARVGETGEVFYTSEAEKNRFSHPHDGLQYITVDLEYATEQEAVSTRSRARGIPERSGGWKGAT